jgi:3-carboxy-cis,cis-muconate cycloisomerase
MEMRLVNALATTEALAEVFSDTAMLQALIDVEVGLARVQARLGILPPGAAEAIAAAAYSEPFDAAALSRAARSSGTVVIPFVQALTDRVRTLSGAAGGFVHWGATSQDIADTAFNVCLAHACDRLAADHDALSAAIERLSDAHATTVMLGRTLLQPAPPITFGLKVAGWHAAGERNWARVTSARREALVVQFGGASGTLAALGPAGLDVGRMLAAELGLGYPDAPWHAHRDRLAAFVTALGVSTGTLGKIARDISLLMQHEVGEAAEPGGRSSTMPQKRNPAAAAVAIAASTRTPGLVAAFLTGMVQEHERAVGGWHAEWPTVAALVQATGAAFEALLGAIDGLAVDPVRMRANLDATGGGVFAECAMMRLAPTMGRDAAHALVQRAVGDRQSSGRPLVDVLAAMPEVTAHVSPDELRQLCSPEGYLGAAESLRLQLLGRCTP